MSRDFVRVRLCCEGCLDTAVVQVGRNEDNNCLRELVLPSAWGWRDGLVICDSCVQAFERHMASFWKRRLSTGTPQWAPHTPEHHDEVEPGCPECLETMPSGVQR